MAAASPARTAAEEQDISEKLDEVLKRKLSAQDKVSEDKAPEDDVVLSSWTKKAVDKATGQKKAKALKKKAKGGEKKPKSRKIVKSLDEVLKSASDDSDRPSYLPARRDVYKEVGITQAEVDAYWDRRDDSAQTGVDKFLFIAYPLGFAAFIAICFSVYDSIVNPQTEYLASMTGTG